MILRFRFFLVNDFGLLFALFWLFLASISGFTYFVTAFIGKPQTAVYAGFIVFLVCYSTTGGSGQRGFTAQLMHAVQLGLARLAG